MSNQASGSAAEQAADAAASTMLDDVPKGAFALAGAAVGLLLLGWLLVYFLIFLPRGPVG